MYRFRGAFGTYYVVTPRSAGPAIATTPEMRREHPERLITVLRHLDRDHADDLARLLRELHLPPLVGLGTGEMDVAERERRWRALEHTLARAKVQIFEAPHRRVVRPVAGKAEPEVIGPQEDDVEPPKEVGVILVDSLGEPEKGRIARFSLFSDDIFDVPLDKDGFAKRGDLTSAAKAKVSFPAITKRPAEPLPTTFPPEKLLPYSHKTRQQLEARMPVALGSVLTLQRKRRHATVIELRQFHAQSGVLLPGAEPGASTSGETVTGIRALSACLEYGEPFKAPHIRVTGHTGAKEDATISQHRADVCRALLARDRDAFGASSEAKFRTDDVQEILAWIARKFGWDCHPGAATNEKNAATKGAIVKFKKRHKAEMGSGLTEDDSTDAETWSAFFDLYMRALDDSGKKSRNKPYLHIRRIDYIWPVKMAEIVFGKPNAIRYKDLEPLNPKHLYPHGGWHDLWAGDDIAIPPDWAGPLEDAGYLILDADPSPAEDAKAPLPIAMEHALGCADHHAMHPFWKGQNRVDRERRVEVLFFQQGQTPEDVCGLGGCNASTCELYDPREYTFEYVPIAKVKVHEDQITFVVLDPTESPARAVEGLEVIVTYPDGKQESYETNASGLVEIHGVPSGLYKLTIPSLDVDDWFDAPIP